MTLRSVALIGLFALSQMAPSCAPTAGDLAGILDRLEERPSVLPKDYMEWQSRSSATAEALIVKFIAYATSRQITVQFQDLDAHGWMGISSFSQNIILINSTLGSDAALATLIHELGHRCHEHLGPLKTTGEVIAESVAYLVLEDVPDLDTARYSLSYILYIAPSGTRAVIYRQYAGLIQACAQDLKRVLA